MASPCLLNLLKININNRKLLWQELETLKEIK